MPPLTTPVVVGRADRAGSPPPAVLDYATGGRSRLGSWVRRYVPPLSILLAGAILGAACGYFAQPRVYQSVGYLRAYHHSEAAELLADPAVSLRRHMTALTSRSVIDDLALGLSTDTPLSADQLQAALSVEPVPNSRLMRLSLSHADPVIASSALRQVMDLYSARSDAAYMKEWTPYALHGLPPRGSLTPPLYVATHPVSPAVRVRNPAPVVVAGAVGFLAAALWIPRRAARSDDSTD